MFFIRVSTHSRLKAAGVNNSRVRCRWCSFNTQPPEGGWVEELLQLEEQYLVSTHSRLKAAGWVCPVIKNVIFVSTHSRLKAAG